MILQLTGFDHIDQRLLESDVAGLPFDDALSDALRSKARVITRDGTLVVDADVWFGGAAAARLVAILQEKDVPIRVSAKSNAGTDTLAVYLPATKRKASGTTAAPRRAADVEWPSTGGVELEAVAICADEPPRRVTNMADLAACESALMRAKTAAALAAGVRIREPDRVSIRGELKCGAGVEIDVNVIIEGRVVLGDNVRIGANCIISNATIGDRTIVKPYTLIENAVIGAGTFVGPYGRLRPGSLVGDSVQIGNFVEIKNAEIGAGSRINHLAFVGDSTLGKNVTIGAATVTCNHNRFGVARTIIRDGAYVGSGSMLVAPITIGENATIGAGSTITTDAPADQLTLGRARQVTVPHWKPPATEPEKK